MEYAWYYDLVLLYVVYSFLGWVAETVVSAARGRGFVDRGFAAGPFCYVYGFAAVIMAVGFDDLRGSLGYLFLGCVTVATVVEWFAAKILERLHHRTWWDYSGHRFNIDGYVCLPYSLLWGVLGCLSVLWGNDLLRALFHLMPVWLFRTLAWVLGILALLDQLGSAALLRHRPTPLEGLNRALERQARTLYDRIALRIERRIEGAYPHAVEKPAALEPGVSLADVVWLFTIGSLVGDLVETLFCRMTMGVWMSPSSGVDRRRSRAALQHRVGGCPGDGVGAAAPQKGRQRAHVQRAVRPGHLYGRRLRIYLQRPGRAGVRGDLLGLQQDPLQPGRAHQPAVLLFLGFCRGGVGQTVLPPCIPGHRVHPPAHRPLADRAGRGVHGGEHGSVGAGPDPQRRPLGGRAAGQRAGRVPGRPLPRRADGPDLPQRKENVRERAGLRRP